MRLRPVRWLFAISIGALAAYMLDPKSGEERRKLLRKNLDKARKAGRKARVQAGL